MILNKIDDPRDNLEKARRNELVRFAHACGLETITQEMPAILIRRELRSKGLTNISIPRRVLGAQNQNGPAVPPDQKAVEVNAADDLARQFRQQAPPPPRPPAKPTRLVERPKQEINLLRDECKRLGIKMDRRDRKDSLKAKIAAHGKDTSQRSQ